MDKVQPENQSEHTPVGPTRDVASPSATPRPRSCAAKAAGAFCKKQQKPARPGARLQFTGPPPMDKVRPENQSEHTPVGPYARCREPERERRDPVVARPKPPAHSAKNNKSRRGQALGYNSPDRRQWIKSGPKIRASTRRWALRAMSRARSSRRDAVAPRPKPPAQRAKNNKSRRGQALGYNSPDRRQWIKSSPKIRASTRRWALRAMSRARSSRRDAVAPRPKPPAQRAKNNKSRRGQALGYDSPHRRQWIKSGPKLRASTRRRALRAMSRARSSRRDAVAPRPRPPAQRAKNNKSRPGQALGYDSPHRRQWIKSGPKLRASTRRRDGQADSDDARAYYRADTRGPSRR